MRNTRVERNLAGLGVGSLVVGGMLLASPSSPASAESVITQLGLDFVGAAGDTLGYSVALSDDGSRVAIGIPEDDPGGASNAGTVQVFDWNGTAWVQAGADIPGEAAADVSGRSISLSGDGTRLAVGAPLNDSWAGFNTGHVRVYSWDGAAWSQLGGDIDGAVDGDQSGSAVSISADGSTVAVGAMFHSLARGHVRVYSWNGTAWTQRGGDIDGEGASDQSGSSVALSADGTRVAIGAFLNSDAGGSAGHVRVWDWNGSAWVRVGQDIDGESAGDWSGWSVGMSADGARIVVGAPNNDGAGTDSGHARVYELIGSTWTQLGGDIDGQSAGDKTGDAVAINASGDRIAVGAPNADPNGRDDAGQVRFFDWSGSSWTLVGSIEGSAARDEFADSVAVSGDGARVAAGARWSDMNGGNSGYARVFQITSVVSQSPTQRNRSEEPGQPGVFLTVSGKVGDRARNVDIAFGSYAIQPRSAVLVTIRHEGTTARQVLSSSRANAGGHYEQTVSLPALTSGRYTITLSAQSATGQLLVLGNRIEVNSAGQLTSLTPEPLQPNIR